MAKKKDPKNWKKILGFAAIFVVLALLVMNYFGVGAGLSQQSFLKTGGYYEGDDMMAFDGTSTNSSRMMAAAPEMGMMDMEESAGIIIDPPVDGSSGAGIADRLIIRTGHLSLVVEDVNTAVEKVKQIANSQDGGFVQNSSIENFDDDSQSGWVQIRIPAGNFDQVMADLKALAIRVESENEGVDDVTGQVVDIQARLTNLRAQEEQYREILDRSESIDDVLAATERLNQVRWDIEYNETQLKNLGERVSFSTINVNLVDEGDVEILGVYWRPILSMKQALRDAVENVTASIDFLVAFLVNLPLLLVWVGLLSFLSWVVWKLGAKIWKKISG